MKSQLRILHLDDNASDLELIRIELEKEGFACELVGVPNDAAFEEALSSNRFDLILSDYAVPGYNGLTALSVAKARQPDVPFILVSGTLGEEQAVNSLLNGATDYVLKQRLSRLGPAVRRALKESEAMAQRKRAEAQLRQSQELFLQITENVTDLIGVLDLEGRRIFSSPSYGQLLGNTELLIRSDSFAEVHPDDRARVKRIFQETVETGEGQRTEYRFILKDKSVRFIESQGSVIRDEQGQVRYVLVVSRDVTEKKQSEARFLRAQRLESIGALASGIAHDLNNILAPIMMSAPMLRWHLKPEEIEKTLVTIETSAQRAAELVKQLLIFGRGVEGQRTLIELQHLIKEILKMASDTFPKAIMVRSKVSAELWPVEADATQLRQVLLNLCVNARDAMPNGGTLTVMAENVSLDEHSGNMIPDAKAGPYVLLRVADTGTGIAPEIMDKIFDPFFTTKEPGKGTGLGLATVLGIVRSHRGFVDMESELSKGTTFAVYLPAAPMRKPAVVQTSSVPPAPGHGESVLVVDDEPQILGITKKTLEKNGYKVFVAEDGVAATVCFTEHQQEIDVVLTDLDMPFMDGVALVRALRRIKPEVPVVACSGIGSEQSLHEKHGLLRELGVEVFLSKPYSGPTLLNALQAVLRGRQPNQSTIRSDQKMP